MTPEERFIFDLDGYLVVKNALSPTQVEELNALADERSEGNFNEWEEFRVDDVSKWGAPCLALVDLAKYNRVVDRRALEDRGDLVDDTGLPQALVGDDENASTGRQHLGQAIDRSGTVYQPRGAAEFENFLEGQAIALSVRWG